MKNKMLTKLLAIILGVILTFGIVGCNRETIIDGEGGGDESETTVIQVMNFGGGVGRAWLDKAAKRFEILKTNESYETDKKGVTVNVDSNIHTGYANMAGSGVHIYFEQPSTGLESMVQQGLMLNINDVVTAISDDTRDYSEREDKKVSIEDKISEDERWQYKGADGNYYLLPHYEFYDGLTYDVDLFTKNNLYLADNPAQGEKYTCTLVKKDFYFVKDKNTKKTCGNDGIYGTQDDGLPTTLLEFVALCDYMKEKKSITPFTVAGGHIDYVNYFTIGLWTALSGYDQVKTAFTFNSGDKTVDTITGFDDKGLLFEGVTDIVKPTFETVKVTPETGYKAYNSLGKYYALAFGELMVDRNWISSKSTQNTHLHTDAMRDFILNGQGKNAKIGMIMEGSYWLNEAEDNEIFDEYEIFSDGEEKNIAWMPLPTSFDVPVTEGNGREMTLMNGVNTYAFVNGNLATKPNTAGVIKACKDFLKFLYSDAELKNFIAQSGTTKAHIDIEITSDLLRDLSLGQKSVMEYRANNRVVQQGDNNPTFRSNMVNLTYGIEKGFKTNYGAIATNYVCIVEGVRKGMDAKDYYNALKITESKWLSDYYKGATN